MMENLVHQTHIIKGDGKPEQLYRGIGSVEQARRIVSAIGRTHLQLFLQHILRNFPAVLPESILYLCYDVRHLSTLVLTGSAQSGNSRGDRRRLTADDKAHVGYG